MASIAILSPGFPGTRGGVTAHTKRLARAWSDSGHETTVIGDLSDGPEVVVERLHDANAKYLLVQYVPFLYGRRGLSRVPERIARQARNRGIRVTTFVHEPWVPPTRLPWLVLSPLQRWQLRRLLGLSDAVVTAVPHWGDCGALTRTLCTSGATWVLFPTQARSNRFSNPRLCSLHSRRGCVGTGSLLLRSHWVPDRHLRSSGPTKPRS